MYDLILCAKEIVKPVGIVTPEFAMTPQIVKTVGVAAPGFAVTPRGPRTFKKMPL